MAGSAHHVRGTASLGARRPAPYPIGLAAVLVTVGMLFAAFTAALLVRRTGTDWAPVALPPIVWVNTVILLISSGVVELARAAAGRSDSRRCARWLAVAGLLGVFFLAGQVTAWRLLALRGVFLPSNPHAAFFYVLSAVHAAHLLGGLAALGWTLSRTARGGYTAEHHAGLTHAAIYWHFVGGVWVFLLIVLSTL